MHELSYVLNFLEAAEEELQTRNIQEPVREIAVEVGEMTGIVPAYLERYFPDAKKGTRFENASLNITFIPAEIACETCNTAYHPEPENRYACPNCQSKNGKIIRGRECNLKEIRF